MVQARTDIQPAGPIRGQGFKEGRMRGWIGMGTAPTEERCVPVRRGVDYLPEMREECKRFIRLLRKVFGPEPPGAKLRITCNQHDFGEYLEVVCHYDDAIPESLEYALKLGGNLPRTWLAKKGGL